MAKIGGIGHLLARRRGHLQAGVVEEQHRHHGDEHRMGGQESVAAEAVYPVPGRKDGDGHDEERQHRPARPRPERRHPLAVTQRHDRGHDGEPDEGRRVHVFPGAPTEPKNSSIAANDTIVSDPPIQIGLEIQ
jgi:hypothetical protein